LAVRFDPIDIQLAFPASRRRVPTQKTSRWRRRARSCVVAGLLAWSFSPTAKAADLHLGTINVPVDLTGVTTNTTVQTNVLGNLLPLPINLSGPSVNVSTTINLLGNPVTVTLNVPSTPGGGPVTINVPISVPGGALGGVINALDAITAVRRNDAILGLDLGLDRQIDILTNGHWGGSDDLWSEPSALGGPRPSAAILDTWGSGAPNRLASFGETFAASLQQARQANAPAPYGPPYGLGASSRPPPVRSPFDVWVEGAVAHFSDGSDQSERHGHLGVLYVGADYRLAPNLLVGALVQFNQTSHSFDALDSSGRDTGWMVGPYATVRLTPNLFFQARAAWGKSDVKLDLDDTHTDSFDAERWLVRGTLLGPWRWGPWQFRPRASVGYIEERQESYVSSLGGAVPGQSVALGQAKFGPEFAYRYRLANGSIVEPNLLVEGIWNFLRDGGVLNLDDLAGGDKLRGRAEAGVTLRTPRGASFGASVSYDGIGSTDHQAVGGKLRVQVPLN
jgi:outer membrane autotransporter protein